MTWGPLYEGWGTLYDGQGTSYDGQVILCVYIFGIILFAKVAKKLGIWLKARFLLAICYAFWRKGGQIHIVAVAYSGFWDCEIASM